MKKDLIRLSVTKRRITVFMVIMVFITGAICYDLLPKQQYPVISLPMVVISAVYPGASAEDMEELVTSKIEDCCMEATGFDYVTSQSYNGITVVKTFFTYDLSPDELKQAKDDLRVDIENADLPEGVTNLNYNDDAFDTAGLILAFTGEDASIDELSSRAEDLKDELLGMDGVSKAEIDGDLEKQVKVTVNAPKANYLGVSLTSISSIISAQNSTIPVGTLEFDNDEININTSGKLENLDEIKNIIVTADASTGAIVKLGDIADVEFGYDDDDKSYAFNGKNAVILSIYFNEGENVLKIGKEVMKTVDKYKAGIGDGVNIDKVVYLPDDVTSSINDFLVNLVESIVIVLGVIMIGMSITNGIIVSVVIPLVIFASFICMKLFGLEINFVSLGSLIVALGMLVDNAIVVSDAIQVRVDNGEERLSACVNGAKEVALPVFASTLTTVIIYSAFFMLPGAMKELAIGLPIIVISALSCSFAAAMLVTPVMCYIMLKKSKPSKQKASRVRNLFKNLLNTAMKHKPATAVICVAAVAASAALISRLDLELIPSSDKEILDIDITSYNYYDIRKTDRLVRQVEDILSKEPENAGYLSATGGHVPKYDFGTQPATDSVNKGSIIYNINLKEGGRFKTKSAYRQYLQNLIDEKIGGAKIIVSELNIMPEKTDPISITLYGDNTEKLNVAGNNALNYLKTVEGAESAYADRKYNTYNYYINMKPDELNTCGLTKAQVQYELNYAIMGGTASLFRKNGQEYPIVVKSDINNTDSLRDYQFVSDITGGKYKLSQFADVGVSDDSSIITRYNGKKSITVSCYAKDGKSPVEIARSLYNEINKSGMNGIDAAVQGNLDTFNTAMDSLIKGAALALLAMIFVLYVQFYSLKRALIILASIPFSLIGSSVGLWITGQNLSIFAMIGIISLLGVVVNNAIVLMDFIDNELKTGSDTKTACIDAVEKRFRPILLSTTTTVLGLIPLAIAGNPIFKGLSIAFMSGLTTSLLFTLVIIPTICSVLLKPAE